MAKKKQTKDLRLSTKIKTLESIYSQKEVAKKLGVSVATVRNWKTGKSLPRKEAEQKINRVYGHNKKKTTLSGLKKVVKTEKKREQKKKTDLQRRYVENDPFLVSAKKFIRGITKDKEIINRFLSIGYEYVATFDHRRGQVISMFDYANRIFGKPPKTKKVTVTGIYSNHYAFEDEGEAYKGYLSAGRMPTLDGYSVHWNLDKTLDYLEGKFLSTTSQVGKRTDNAIQFIAYYL
jgi:transcriptional regulator with XRE-family HTH domain